MKKTKKHFSLKILFLFLNIIVYGQPNLKVVYKLSHHIKPSELTKKTDSENLDRGITKIIDEVIDNSENLIEYTLLSNYIKSYFFRTTNIPENYSQLQIAVLKYYLNHNYYIDSSSQTLYEFFDGLGDKFLIKLDYKSIEWEILNDTKNIQGYSCYKAKAKFKDNQFNINTLDVWFTPEINNSHGPYIAYGLPGLVLELNTDTYKIFANKITFELKDNEVLKIEIPKYKITTKEKLDEKVKNMRQ